MWQSIASFMSASTDGRAGDADFEALAGTVFRHQYERIPVYRRFCDARGVTPAVVARWSDIPAVPSDLFKEPFLPPAAEGSVRPHVFLSSGTTRGSERRGRHELASLDLYRQSAVVHFRRMVLTDAPGKMATIVLGPTAATHPHSSLGQMFSWCTEDFAGGEVATPMRPDGALALDDTIGWLQARAKETRPVLILAITSALTAVLERLRDRRLELRLPADSRFVDTGGRKGGRVLSANGLLRAAWRWLHIPAYLGLNEYGMTEMLSQFYDDAWLSRCEGRLAPRAKLGPPWTRTLVVDPATLAPLPDGATGLLRHFDLANCESVSAIQTMDVGRTVGRGFEIVGRALEADARGCSQLLAVLDDIGRTGGRTS